jgi:subfamily B ATP-binding cassette protein MsbA
MMRHAFWKTAAELLRYRRLLAIALVGAIISAACFGAGIGLMLPILSLFFDSQAIATARAGGVEAHPLRRLVEHVLISAGEQTPAWRVAIAERLWSIIPDSLFRSFVLVMVTLGVLSVIGSVGRYLHELFTITATQRWAADTRERLYRTLIQAPIGRVALDEGSGFGSRVMVDTGAVSRGHLAILSKAVADILKGLTCFIVAMLLDWRLTLLAMVVVVPIALLLRRFGKVIRRASKRALHQQAAMLQSLNVVFGGLSVLKVHNAEGYERRRFRRMNRAVFQQQMRMRQARALASPTVETLALIGVIVAASSAAWMIFERGYPPERFLTVLILLAAGGASIKPLAGIQAQVKESQAAAERLLEALAVKSEPILPETRRLFPSLPRHRVEVAFEGVAFRYPKANREALAEIDLRVAHGQTIAIVGPNGAGKSTLLSLLPRLIEPTAGRVTIDGTDIASVNLRSLREQIGVVTQQTVLFEGTIADNIAYGRRHAPRAAIVAAARAAFAHEFIDAHPAGYDRVLGEGGEGLSGGQKQRLAIARAVLRDPAILILDEATSQIDAESEAKIAQALRELRQGRTTFVIAHRLSTVVDADAIVVMVDGRISAIGTHHELLQRSPVYQTLTRTQLSQTPTDPTAALDHSDTAHDHATG